MLTKKGNDEGSKLAPQMQLPARQNNNQQASFCLSTFSSTPLLHSVNTTVTPASIFISEPHPTHFTMADAPEKAPRIDPAIDVDGETHDAEKKDKPRDSKGWDGKLRVDKSVLVNGRDQDAAESEPEVSEDEGPPPEQLPADEDLLEDYPEDEEEIELVHLRISDMAALRLERFKKLKRLGLRQNQITDVKIPDDIAPNLQDVDFYDNLISHIRGFDACSDLELLDLSFNKIKHIKRIGHLTKLKDLFFVQNKISTIEGLENLTNLRQVELGANRIRVGTHGTTSLCIR